MNTEANTFKSGYVAIVGRPNVGKSTLLNAIVGEKISIVSPKAQTTRHAVLGIKTTSAYQMVFVDTPGYHLGQSQALNKYMNKTALTATHEVEVIVFVVHANRWTQEDKALLSKFSDKGPPVVAVVNKVDLVKNKQSLLPFLDELSGRYPFHSMIPVSARRYDGVDELEKLVAGLLPVGQAYFDQDQITDKSLRFLAAELIREKLFHVLRDELPYALTVEIEEFVEQTEINRISAIIWLDKSSHKHIVIGHQGSVLKSVGKAARESMQRLFHKKVFLKLWVKVKAGWNDDRDALRNLGYHDNFD